MYSRMGKIVSERKALHKTEEKPRAHNSDWERESWAQTSALCRETIVGGYPDSQLNHKHQVAVVGKTKRESKNFTLIGGGAIVSDNFIVSVAQNFINYHGLLKYIMFFVRVGYTDLNSQEGGEVEVEKVFIYGYNPKLVLNDIAVLKLRKSLMLASNVYLKKLRIALPEVSYGNEVGRVSGFGYTWVMHGRNYRTGSYFRGFGTTDHKLKYAIVKILQDEECKNIHDDIDPYQQLCGIMQTDQQGQDWGICTGDTGAPLVINSTIVGLAIKNPHDCNDTRTGCIYTKMSFFNVFIEHIIKGIHIPGITVYDNWEFILEEEII